MISGGTLNYWLAKENIDLRTIGLFAFVALPYAINFIWAPLFDSIKLGWLAKLLGHRLSWIVSLQCLLALTIFCLSFTDPLKNFYHFSILSLVVAFFSSAQDTVLGALRTEIIDKELQGPASGTYIVGYRVGMLISSSGAILASKYTSWKHIYLSFSFSILLISLMLIILLPRNLNIDYPISTNLIVKRRFFSWINSFINTIISPMGKPIFVVLILIFLILYRIPDNFISQMMNPFLIHMGYDELEVASVGKSFGVFGSIVGGVIASNLMKKGTIINNLLVFGVLHALAHSFFMIQGLAGKNIFILFWVIGFESITGGMAMAAYIALIASLCQGRFRATQYSFLSSMMGFSRSILPSISGYIVADFGWQHFFFFATLASIPSLILIKIINLKQNI